MILTLVACGSKPSDNNNNTDSTAFPTKTMTIVCPYGAGGGTDLALQILAECGKDTFGQTINVENKTGGSGTVGLTEALNAAADGYTLGTCSVDLITLPLLGLAPAETTRDAFDPICVINGEPAAIIVRADSRWNTIQDFLAEAKEKPGTVQLANSGMGDIWHLAAIGIELETGASFNHVPFDGAASALTAVLSGHVDAVTCSAAAAASPSPAVISSMGASAIILVSPMTATGTWASLVTFTWLSIRAAPTDTKPSILVAVATII